MQLRIVLVLILIFGQYALSQKQNWRVAAPGASTGGYCMVDNDAPAELQAYRPPYSFVDTNNQRALWHRVYHGPRTVPGADSADALFWRSMTGDSLDNTFAGPFPIGFSFPYFGRRYDSLYLSSNGFIVFGQWNAVTDTSGPVIWAPPTSAGFGCMPSTALPAASAVFLGTDGIRVMRGTDTARTYFRTSVTGDTFLLTIYNYHLKLIDGYQQGSYARVDIQVMLLQHDSSLSFSYRQFAGTAPLPIGEIPAERLFRLGCVTQGCLENAATIGIQGDTRTTGVSYMCQGHFSQSGVADLHSALTIKFTPVTNKRRVLAVVSPASNHEYMEGDSIAVTASLENLTDSVQTFRCKVRILKSALIPYGHGLPVLYDGSDSVMTFAPHETRSLTFAAWHSTVGVDSQRGSLAIKVIANPLDSTLRELDAWQADDTLGTCAFLLHRLSSFNDHCSTYDEIAFATRIVPDGNLWVNKGASVVDGYVNTFLPVPPLGPQTKYPYERGGFVKSPVMRFDRRDVNGIEYEHCGYAGGALGDGGTGDTLISHPIDLTGRRNPVLAFSYERGGKINCPRWYDVGTALGPERTVTNPDHSVIYRAGDSLEVSWGAAGDSTNVESWRKVWALDGGKDRLFTRVFIPIDSQFCTRSFRFRMRLKGKNDFPDGSPNDDDDPWYIDNVAIYDDSTHDVEITAVYPGRNYPYMIVPSTQSFYPAEVMVVNNGGTTTPGMSIREEIGDPTDLHVPRDVVDTILSIPPILPHTTVVLPLQTFDGRRWGPGQYYVTASIDNARPDVDSLNDSTTALVTLLWDDTFAYASNQSSVGSLMSPTSAGLCLQLPDRELPLGGTGSSGTGPGAIASKFTLTVRDTLYGYFAWLGGQNQSPDSIAFALHRSAGNLPGAVISRECATVRTVRTGPFDALSHYEVPCGHIALDPGEYWVSVSQLTSGGLQLGANSDKSSVDWVVYDSTPSRRHEFVTNYEEEVGCFAYTNSVDLTGWRPFYDSAGMGSPGYSFPTDRTAYLHTSLQCGTTTMRFYGQGSWIPMIRPNFSNRYSGIENSNVGPISSTLALLTAAPEPFSGVTTISYTLPNSSPIQLSVTNVIGKRVRTLAGSTHTGINTAVWDGRSDSGSPVPPGTYVVLLRTMGRTLSTLLHIIR
jgi:hypothetical protein